MIEFTRRRSAYAIRVATLLPHLPQALQTMEQVAAPQQLAAKDTIVPTLGTARSGRDKRAPIATARYEDRSRCVFIGWGLWCYEEFLCVFQRRLSRRPTDNAVALNDKWIIIWTVRQFNCAISPATLLPPSLPFLPSVSPRHRHTEDLPSFLSLLFPHDQSSHTLLIPHDLFTLTALPESLLFEATGSTTKLNWQTQSN